MPGTAPKVNITTAMNTHTDDLMRELKSKLGPGLFVEIVFQDGNATLTATGAKIGSEEVTARGKTLTVCVSKAVGEIDKIIATLPTPKRGRPRKNPEPVADVHPLPRKSAKRGTAPTTSRAKRVPPRKLSLVPKKVATRRTPR